MVFQSYALYPHMTVFENIAYPLRRRGVPKAEIEAAKVQGRSAPSAARPLLNAIRGNSPAGSGSALRWPERWSADPQPS